jgi:hypothetical protein
MKKMTELFWDTFEELKEGTNPLEPLNSPMNPINSPLHPLRSPLHPLNSPLHPLNNALTGNLVEKRAKMLVQLLKANIVD